MTAIVRTPGVSEDLLKNVLEWKRTGTTKDNVVGRLRLHLHMSGIDTLPHHGTNVTIKFFHYELVECRRPP